MIAFQVLLWYIAPVRQTSLQVRRSSRVGTPHGRVRIEDTEVKIRVCVGPSRIAGQGLFAGQDIQTGAKIIRYIGEKISREESDRRLAAGNVYIFGLNERYSIDGDIPRNTARYINHACDPNCHTEQFGNTIWIVALRDIQSGEELTYNYGYRINEEPIEPCHCGAPHCCGSILAQRYWDRIAPPTHP